MKKSGLPKLKISIDSRTELDRMQHRTVTAATSQNKRPRMHTKTTSMDSAFKRIGTSIPGQRQHVYSAFETKLELDRWLDQMEISLRTWAPAQNYVEELERVMIYVDYIDKLMIQSGQTENIGLTRGTDGMKKCLKTMNEAHEAEVQNAVYQCENTLRLKEKVTTKTKESVTQTMSLWEIAPELVLQTQEEFEDPQEFQDMNEALWKLFQTKASDAPEQLMKLHHKMSVKDQQQVLDRQLTAPNYDVDKFCDSLRGTMENLYAGTKSNIQKQLTKHCKNQSVQTTAAFYDSKDYETMKEQNSLMEQQCEKLQEKIMIQYECVENADKKYQRYEDMYMRANADLQVAEVKAASMEKDNIKLTEDYKKRKITNRNQKEQLEDLQKQNEKMKVQLQYLKTSNEELRQGMRETKEQLQEAEKKHEGYIRLEMQRMEQIKALEESLEETNINLQALEKEKSQRRQRARTEFHRKPSNISPNGTIGNIDEAVDSPVTNSQATLNPDASKKLVKFQSVESSMSRLDDSEYAQTFDSEQFPEQGFAATMPAQDTQKYQLDSPRRSSKGKKASKTLKKAPNKSKAPQQRQATVPPSQPARSKEVRITAPKVEKPKRREEPRQERGQIQEETVAQIYQDSSEDEDEYEDSQNVEEQVPLQYSQKRGQYVPIDELEDDFERSAPAEVSHPRREVQRKNRQRDSSESLGEDQNTSQRKQTRFNRDSEENLLEESHELQLSQDRQQYAPNSDQLAPRQKAGQKSSERSNEQPRVRSQVPEHRDEAPKVRKNAPEQSSKSAPNVHKTPDRARPTPQVDHEPSKRSPDQISQPPHHDREPATPEAIHTQPHRKVKRQTPVQESSQSRQQIEPNPPVYEDSYLDHEVDQYIPTNVAFDPRAEVKQIFKNVQFDELANSMQEVEEYINERDFSHERQESAQKVSCENEVQHKANSEQQNMGIKERLFPQQRNNPNIHESDPRQVQASELEHSSPVPEQEEAFAMLDYANQIKSAIQNPVSRQNYPDVPEKVQEVSYKQARQQTQRKKTIIDTIKNPPKVEFVDQRETSAKPKESILDQLDQTVKILVSEKVGKELTKIETRAHNQEVKNTLEKIFTPGSRSPQSSDKSEQKIFHRDRHQVQKQVAEHIFESEYYHPVPEMEKNISVKDEDIYTRRSLDEQKPRRKQTSRIESQSNSPRERIATQPKRTQEQHNETQTPAYTAREFERKLTTPRHRLEKTSITPKANQFISTSQPPSTRHSTIPPSSLYKNQPNPIGRKQTNQIPMTGNYTGKDQKYIEHRHTDYGPATAGSSPMNAQYRDSSNSPYKDPAIAQQRTRTLSEDALYYSKYTIPARWENVEANSIGVQYNYRTRKIEESQGSRRININERLRTTDAVWNLSSTPKIQGDIFFSGGSNFNPTSMIRGAHATAFDGVHMDSVHSRYRAALKPSIGFDQWFEQVVAKHEKVHPNCIEGENCIHLRRAYEMKRKRDEEKKDKEMKE